jgi:uroporphyrinogen decarboxylase
VERSKNKILEEIIMKRNGKEIIAKAMRHEELDVIPWVPFAGVHAGFLKGYGADEVLKDGDKLLESLLEVNEKYQPDGQPVCFDLQLEAEILGCDLKWADNCPPSVISHVFADTDELPEPNIEATQGRLPLVLKATRDLKEKVGDHTAIYGLYCGPFTLASHLRGTKLFMDMIMNPDYMTKLMTFCTKLAIQMNKMYIDAGCDVVAPVDPLISQISPKHFEQFCAGPYKEVFADIRKQDCFSAFFVCGNAIKNIEGMCLTEPDAISVDENLNMVEAKKITDEYNVTLGGNIPLTTAMLYGNQQDNMKFVVDLIDSIPSNKNFILAPGCDMPYNVPIANGIAATQAALDPEGVRKLVENYTTVDVTEGIEVDLPDYANLKKPLLELFTLDPVACAACTYMLAAVEGAKKIIGEEDVDWGDYRYNKLEDIARMAKVGVKNLPSIYINGELKYDSLIPTIDELVEVLKAL